MRRFLFDWPIFGLGLALSLCGLVLVYSATWVAGDPPGPYFAPLFIRQFLAFLVALVLFHFARRIKWGLKPDSWIWFYLPIILLLLLVVVIGHGTATHGAQRWIDLGFFQLQPSEPAKVAWILLLAWLLSVEPAYVIRNFWLAFFLMISMVALMMAQPDLGTSMVFVFIFFVVTLLSPVDRRLILRVVATLIVLVIPAFFFLRIYQQNRVLELIGLQKWQVVDTVEDARYQLTLEDALKMEPERGLEIGDVFIDKANEMGVGYQAMQGMIALGSGGLTGKGFLRGTQARGGFVPVVDSDFIFALVGEEFGFVGTAVLLLLFFLLIARILALAHDVHSDYERFICYGASALLLLQVLVGAGMVMRLMPVTGIPLPFISRGGSAMITFWLLLAILESIYARSQGEYGQQRRLRRRA